MPVRSSAAAGRLRAACGRDLRLLPKRERRAALSAAVVARPLTEIVLARERRMGTGFVAPLLLELDGLLSLHGISSHEGVKQEGTTGTCDPLAHPTSCPTARSASRIELR